MSLYIGVTFDRAPGAAESPVLDESHELGLHRRRKIHDLVEVEGSAGSLFDQTGTTPGQERRRSPAEQCLFEQRGGRGVHSNERPRTPRLAMKRPSEGRLRRSRAHRR